MNVAILTFHFNFNYGAVMQAYGLQTALEMLGHKPFFPLRVPPFLVSNSVFWRGLNLRRDPTGVPALIAHRIYSLPRRQGFNRFRKRYLHFSPNTRSLEGLRSACEGHAIVVGADQTWNTNLMRRPNDYYFGGWVDTDRTRLVSYGSCFGQVDQRFANELGPLLRRFHHLSARNSTSTRYASKFAGRNVPYVVDPSLIGDFRQFPAASEFHDWIYVYAIAPENVPALRAEAEALRKETGKRIVAIPSEYKIDLSWADAVLDQATPEKWIGCFKAAALIVTDSFHGCAFAVKCEKPLRALCNGWRSLRLEEFLTRYAYQDAIFSPADAGSRSIKQIIAASPDRCLLSKDILESRAYLAEALN